jgi:hypothetical protein
VVSSLIIISFNIFRLIKVAFCVIYLNKYRKQKKMSTPNALENIVL